MDRAFVDAHCAGFDAYARQTRAVDGRVVADNGVDDTHQPGGSDVRPIVAHGDLLAMGLTQQRHAVATIGEATNLLLMRGMIGKPGAGVVRCVGIPTATRTRYWEKMPRGVPGRVGRPVRHH